MGIVMEMMKLLEWVSGKYKDVMKINWDSEIGIVMKLVIFWERYKKAMKKNWDAGMGIVMEMVKLLEWEKYKKTMEKNWDAGMRIVMEMVKLLVGMSEEHEDVIEIN
ncbi:hypothetical protein H0E87_001555 [Populus deltoides]|uniref:Uncharacterized protein n=1 Tax=Populus deltoides TaxID=3696 RepID=A0A8T2ZTM2_POPDE|nr:hypothetical protein H0E87_001555 [Populus deltoides]